MKIFLQIQFYIRNQADKLPIYRNDIVNFISQQYVGIFQELDYNVRMVGRRGRILGQQQTPERVARKHFTNKQHH